MTSFIELGLKSYKNVYIVIYGSQNHRPIGYDIIWYWKNY